MFTGLCVGAAVSSVIALLLAAGCIAKPPAAKPVVVAAPPPAPVMLSGGRLPRDVTPRAYSLELEIIPASDRFSGRVQIAVELHTPTRRILLHGRSLDVSSAKVHVGSSVVQARYAQLDETGLAELQLDEEVPAGAARLELTYSAPFDRTLVGLYKVESGGNPYAFTQFEPTSARLAFPCFDEPAWKTPFDMWLTVPADQQAITNTRETLVELGEAGKKRMRFATTKPLPTYLIAFIVGPLDIVEAQPIPPTPQRPTPLPLRGVAVKGQGALLKYALENTNPLLSWLERYTQIPYPYEKLDLIAVPDFGSGAMENAGAITYREWLLLMDGATAPEGQKRAYAQVHAHELAHHWFGNLVTMPFWDDIWLNEAFATWMGHRTVGGVRPDDKSELALLGSILGAMDADSRPSARRIREPIVSAHDIANAFDAITYRKGAGVLAMFERYLGPEVFQAGISAHLKAHAHGVADAGMLMAALSKSANKDVATAMSTFLAQPGVPLIEASARCEGGKGAIDLKQSRYFPLGLAPAAPPDTPPLWHVPVCVRYESRGKPFESCTLLTEAQGSLALEACPTWFFPSAGASGYYRFALGEADLKKLEQRGIDKLSSPEKLALSDSLQAGYASGALSAKAVLPALTSLAGDPERAVALAPVSILRMIHRNMVDDSSRPKLERFVQKLYGARMKKLGLAARATDSGDTLLLRSELANVLADIGRDPWVRGKLAEAGTQALRAEPGAAPDAAISAELRGLALVVALQDGEPALFDAAYAKLGAATDPTERGRLLGSLSSVVGAGGPRALALSLDPVLRTNEVLVPLRSQLADPRTRDAAWEFLQARFADVQGRIGKQRGSSLPWLASFFCNTDMAARAEAFFASRVNELVGGPRALAGALEEVRSCAAQVDAQRAATLAVITK
jgi:alanyl aminopeptidase